MSQLSIIGLGLISIALVYVLFMGTQQGWEAFVTAVGAMAFWIGLR